MLSLLLFLGCAINAYHADRKHLGATLFRRFYSATQILCRARSAKHPHRIVGYRAAVGGYARAVEGVIGFPIEEDGYACRRVVKWVLWLQVGEFPIILTHLNMEWLPLESG